ncbi:uncharacterized protein [Palaemon carinicauda]|uniref:uncharacterized protein n=1 Tax=Palaemon carinicauda TaxID=392227 RepID=UPI0035B60778
MGNKSSYPATVSLRITTSSRAPTACHDEDASTGMPLQSPPQSRDLMRRLCRLQKRARRNSKTPQVAEMHLQKAVNIYDKEDLVLSLRAPDGSPEKVEKYFEQLLSEEKGRLIREDEEVKRRWNGKATGPDLIPVEVWKGLGEEDVNISCDPTVKIFEEVKIPEMW